MATGTAPRATHATLAELLLRAAARKPDAVALRQPPVEDGGEWLAITYGELGRTAREIALGLASLGIAPGDRVALLADTRPEWTLADAGIVAAGATVVPIYQTNSPEECRYVLAHSGARAVLCEDAKQLAKVQQVRAQCPALEHVVVLIGDGGDGVLSLAGLRARGAAVEDGEDRLAERLTDVRPQDPATIVYTSGTTGPPKGCVLTHGNWLAAIEMYAAQVPFGEQPTVFLFLPLAHSLARVVQLVTLDVGGTLAFWRGDPKRIMDDVAATHPTHLPVVPRVLEKVRARVLDEVEQGGALEQRAFHAALSLGRRRAAARRRAGSRTPPALVVAHALADRAVLARVRETFGDRLEQLLVGAAPVGPEVLAFFEACGITVLEGYGLTETCAAATINVPDATRIGTAGQPLPGVEVRIAADGEILLRGPNVFPGYYEDEIASREAVDDSGWLHTGDLGTLDDGGFLRITGRTKDLIITSSGKNITPSNLEAGLREIRWVSQAVAYGDRRPYLVALLTLDPDELHALAEHAGLDDGADAAAVAADPHVRELLDAEVASVNARFARIEQIKRFGVLDHDLTQAAGELTPTLKLKRNVVYERYADDFAGLYEAP
jgi:long-chain acyl-CoA synthetase